MNSLTKLHFKIASEEWEFNKIHALNYRTFVEEIPQHEKTINRKLVDKFNSQNIYIICVSEVDLLGMIAIRDIRPFSLDAKLENIDSYLPEYNSICEIRLLSIEKNRRHGRVIQGLILELAKYCDEKNYDLAIISGTVRQVKLYRHFGFEIFGPLVGSEGAQYQPMYLTLDNYRKLKESTRVFKGNKLDELKNKINFLPGPVEINKAVIKAYSAAPVSHRSEEFVAHFMETKKILCEMFECKYTAIFMGSGTLANDVVAGQISRLKEKGMVLVNGEFGRRLLEHAKSAGLVFEEWIIEDGAEFNDKDIVEKLNKNKKLKWLWCVHCETSTGVINNMSFLKGYCLKNKIKLCLDCISSIGMIKVDLKNIYLSTGVSGKGLGALPGIAMVFYHHEVSASPKVLPRYIDLGLYGESSTNPFTLSSNLLYALKTSLDITDWPARYKEVKLWSELIRERILDMGFTLVSKQVEKVPFVMSIDLPVSISSKKLAQDAEERGCLLSYNSEYLLEKNRVQICIMRSLKQEQVEVLLKVLEMLAVEYEI